MGGIVVGVDGSVHAVDAAVRHRGVPMPQLPSVGRRGVAAAFIAEDVGSEAAAVLHEPARQRAAQALHAQVDKALDGKPGPENMQVELRSGNPAEELVPSRTNRRLAGRQVMRPRRFSASPDWVDHYSAGQPCAVPSHRRAEPTS
jgi:hypothetical protein